MDRLENKGWRKMEALLDSEMPKVAPLYLRFLPYAAVLIFGLLSGVYFIKRSGDNNIGNTEFVTNNPIQIYDLPKIDVFEVIAQPANPVNALGTANHQNNESLTSSNKLMASVSFPVKTQIYGNNGFLTANRTTENAVLKEEVEQNDLSTTPTINNDQRSILFNAPRNKRSHNESDVQYERELDQTLKNETETVRGNSGIYIPITLNSALTNKNSKTIKASGSLGIVTSGFDEYGVRTGLELKKPITKKLSVTTGFRYSRYTDKYSASYDIDASAAQLRSGYIQNLSQRDVDRNFYELPVYMNYNVTQDVKVKAGFAVTYNTNNAATPDVTARNLALNSNLNNTQLGLARSLYQDHEGYLGEAILGANVTLDRVTLEAEVMKGVISNQTIDDRNILGLRLSYKFGK